MTLIRELEADLTSREVDLPTALRKCRILATRLGSEEFGRWVDWELNGYPEGQPLPEYRRLPVQCYANFIDKGWRADRQPLQLDVLPKEVREALTHSEFRDGIAKASVLVEQGAQIERSDVVPLLQGNMLPGMRCVRVWMALAENGFAELLGNVKTRALDFVLEIERENPDAGEATPGSRPVPAERLGMLVRKHFGSVRTVVQANKSESIPQIADGRVQPDELVVLVSVLETHLSELMLSEHEIRNVNAQLATLTTQFGGSQIDPVVVRQAGRTLRSIIEGAMAILLSRAAQPTVWRWINKMLAKL